MICASFEISAIVKATLSRFASDKFSLMVFTSNGARTQFMPIF